MGAGASDILSLVESLISTCGPVNTLRSMHRDRTNPEELTDCSNGNIDAITSMLNRGDLHEDPGISLHDAVGEWTKAPLLAFIAKHRLDGNRKRSKRPREEIVRAMIWPLSRRATIIRSAASKNSYAMVNILVRWLKAIRDYKGVPTSAWLPALRERD